MVEFNKQRRGFPQHFRTWLAIWMAGMAPMVCMGDPPPWVNYEGTAGPGKGKKVVLVSGDEEYRSEETLPQLGRILARHHGFDCRVLFAIDPKDGTINPNVNNNIPGLDALRSADLLVLFTRFRRLPDPQMKELVDYIESGRPIVALRTATHAFDLPKESPYAKYSWNRKGDGWDGGFGRRVLGETWISHHGHHGKQSTRGIIAPGKEQHSVVRTLRAGDIWGPTDVYGVRLPLPGGCEPLVLGEVLTGMKPTDPPVAGRVNDPMMPIAWTNAYTGSSGKTARVFTTTMGASRDLESEGFRRLLVRACYWALGMEKNLPENTEVDVVPPFEPRPFQFGGFRRGVRPVDLALP